MNEGMDGKACAQYLQSNLSSRGYSVPLFVCEDWEWWVEVQGLDFTCGLGVYGMQIDDSDDLDICVTVLSSLRFDTRLARRSDALEIQLLPFEMRHQENLRIRLPSAGPSRLETRPRRLGLWAVIGIVSGRSRYFFCHRSSFSRIFRTASLSSHDRAASSLRRYESQNAVVTASKAR